MFEHQLFVSALGRKTEPPHQTSFPERILIKNKTHPPWKLRYPTWGKGKSSSNMPYQGDMLISWRVHSSSQSCVFCLDFNLREISSHKIIFSRWLLLSNWSGVTDGWETFDPLPANFGGLVFLSFGFGEFLSSKHDMTFPAGKEVRSCWVFNMIAPRKTRNGRHLTNKLPNVF